MKLQRLSTFSLVMLIAGAIDSIRNLPATALFGSQLIFFFVLSAIIFLLPTALVSAELAATYPEQGGVFDWVTSAFGLRTGFLAIWLQWINTMVWYPTILSFIAGTSAYLIDPALADHASYLVSFVLIFLWSMTLINLRGLHTSAVFASFCTVIGLVIPMLLIICLALVWILHAHPLQIAFTLNAMRPNFSHQADWVSLTAIMASFLGMELAAVHVKDMQHAQTQFPRAMGIAVILILATMILGALAIAIVLPASEINLVEGVLQAFHAFLAAYQMTWMQPILTLMILMGAVGGMVNWMISPAKGLLLAGEHGFLPAWFCHQNRYGVANRILLTQALLISAVCLVFLLMPSVNGSYWLLTDLSTELYMMMYVLMFLAAIVLKLKNTHSMGTFHIPGGRWGTAVISSLGLLGCLLTLVIGFFPPSNIDVGSVHHYEFLFTSGLIVMLIPVLFFYGYQKLQR